MGIRHGARALGLTASIEQAVEERDAATALLTAERLLREEVERRAQDLTAALEATKQDAEARLADAEGAVGEERAVRGQADAQVQAALPAPKPRRKTRTTIAAAHPRDFGTPDAGP